MRLPRRYMGPRWYPGSWPDARSWRHFWRNRAYVKWGWRHWPTSPDLRDS